MNKYEIIGIFGSVTIMAIALAILRFEFGGNVTPATVIKNNDPSVIVVDDSANGSSNALLDTLLEATTYSGELTQLVIDDVEVGEGEEVKVGDIVVVDYIGVTSEGVQFDSSYLRGQPFTFTLGEGRVITGWEKGLLGMKVGGQRILIIPPEEGYGNRQVGPIPPNSVLLFAVTLQNISTN